MRDELLRKLILKVAEEATVKVDENELIIYLDGQRYSGTFHVMPIKSRDGNGNESQAFIMLYGRQFLHMLVSGSEDVNKTILASLEQVDRAKKEIGMMLNSPSAIYQDAIANVLNIKDSDMDYEMEVIIRARHRQTGVYVVKSGMDWTGRKQKDAAKDEVINVLALLTERKIS